jgi:hypothetical protein
MPLSKLHVINVCKKDNGKNECRYLSEDEIKDGVFQCKKLSPEKIIIDEEVDEYLRRKRNYGRNENDYSLGDNCKGYPVLRHKEVGYDKKN